MRRSIHQQKSHSKDRLHFILFRVTLVLTRLLSPSEGPIALFLSFCKKILRVDARQVRKIVSGLVVLNFVFTQSVWADGIVPDQPLVQPQAFSPRSLIGVEIPPLLGTLTDHYAGSGERLVIHLQDSHAHFEAQRNIAKLIDFFLKALPEGTPRLVMLEGAEGLVDTSPLASIQNTQIKESIATYFLKQGLIGGPEYYSITSPKDVVLLGVDDRKLYGENLDYFQKCQGREEALTVEINAILDVLQRIELTSFSESLLKLNELRRQYEKGEAVLGQYCMLLKSFWTETGRLESLFPNISKINKVTALENEIKYNLVNKELVDLISVVQKRLGEKELKDLIQKSLLFRLKKIDQIEYFQLVYGLASRNKIDFKAYPNLSSFFESVFIRQELDPAKVFKELDELDQRIRNSIYRSEQEKSLDQMNRYIFSLDRLIRLSLSRDEFEFYIKERAKYPIETLPAKLQELAQSLGFSLDKPLSINVLSSSLSDLEGFYAMALSRDEAILSNVLERMEEEKSPVTILVTGGFHTTGLTEEFRKKKVSYMVVAPKISTASDRSIYLSTMMDLAGPFDKDLRSLALRLIAPIKFALNPFGSQLDWERIIAKAIIFKMFMEEFSVPMAKPKPLDKEAEAYARTHLSKLKRADGQPRYSDSEVQMIVERIAHVQDLIDIDWSQRNDIQESAFVPVRLSTKEGPKQFLIRWYKGKTPPELGLDTLDYGQLDGKNHFYVLAEKYVPVFEVLKGKKFIAASELDPFLSSFGAREIESLSRLFKDVKIKKAQAQYAKAVQFASFQEDSPRREKWENGIALNYTFDEDPGIKVKSVRVVETLQSSKSKPTRLENRYSLIHATAVAARHAVRWLTNSASSFISKRADKEGARWLRTYFNSLKWFKGRVVIGEGERDKAPMLYIGEELGRGTEQVDMAMDVIELTKGLIKKAVQGTVSVVAYASRNGLLNAPDVYLRKWVVGPQAKGAGIDVSRPVAWNLGRIADKLSGTRGTTVNVSDLKGALLLRPRHKKLIRDLLKAGIQTGEAFDVNDDEAFEIFWKRIKVDIKKTGLLTLGNLILMDDGDLMPSFGLVTGKVDFVVGAGGAPEGVISAAIIESIGGEMSAQLSAYEALQESAESADLERDFDKFSPEEVEKLAKFNIVLPGTETKNEVAWNKVWSSSELASGKDIVVVASAVKENPWIESLHEPAVDGDTGEAKIYSVVASKSGRVRVVEIAYDLGIQDIRAKIDQTDDTEEKLNLHLQWANILAGHGLYQQAAGILNSFISQVTVTDLRVRLESAIAYYEGMNQLVTEGKDIPESLYFFEKAVGFYAAENLGARDLLIRLYRHLGDEALKAKNKEEALVHYRKATQTADYEGFQGDFEEMKAKLSALGVEYRKPVPQVVQAAASDEEIRKLAILNAKLHQKDRAPIAVILGGEANVERVDAIEDMILQTLKSGDAIFLAGELAYPFLIYRNAKLANEPFPDDEIGKAVQEILNNAVYDEDENAFIVGKGMMLYLPQDYVNVTEDESITVVHEVPATYVPKIKMDLGPKTVLQYVKALKDFDTYVSVGELGILRPREEGSREILMDLVDKAEGGRRSVYLAGSAMASAAEKLKISDEKGARNRVTAVLQREEETLQLLNGSKISENIFLQGLKQLVKNEQIDGKTLSALIGQLDQYPGIRWEAYQFMTTYVLSELIRNLQKAVPATYFATDFRVKSIFTDKVIADFPKEGDSKAALKPADIEKWIAESPVKLLDQLFFQGLREKEGGLLFFYRFLSRRSVDLVSLLADRLFIIEELPLDILEPAEPATLRRLDQDRASARLVENAA
jgi:fructose-1,6-bisphosphatase/sedoheptulose 1,7-bisphosphatase-like protein